MKFAVYGLGQFGYAFLKRLETNLSGKHTIYGFDTNAGVVNKLIKERSHPYLYPSHRISGYIHVTYTPEEALKDADIVIVAVPSHNTRTVLTPINNYAKNDVVLLNTAKALDYETGKRLSKLFKENLKIPYRYALFAGGTIAKDLFNSELLGATIASEHEEAARLLKQMLQSDNLKIDTSTDLAGVEYASAFKNVISILAGIVCGLGLSFGSETYILSKAAAEVERLIIQELGGKKETFAIGSQCWGNDMFMSAMGKTRNREFGILVGKGMTTDEALAKMEKEKKTVEGINTLRAINLVTKIEKYPLLSYLYASLIKKEPIDLLAVIDKI